MISKEDQIVSAGQVRLLQESQRRKAPEVGFFFRESSSKWIEKETGVGLVAQVERRVVLPCRCRKWTPSPIPKLVVGEDRERLSVSRAQHHRCFARQVLSLRRAGG